MKSFLTSPTGWMPAYTDEKKTTPAPAEQAQNAVSINADLDRRAIKELFEAPTPVMQTTGWMPLSKRGKSRAAGRVLTAVTRYSSGIVIAARQSGASYYLSILLRQDAMDALQLKIGDRIDCDYRAGYRALRVYKEQQGYKLTPSSTKKGQDRSGERLPGYVQITIDQDEAASFGQKRIEVELAKCIYDEGGLIARW